MTTFLSPQPTLLSFRSSAKPTPSSTTSCVTTGGCSCVQASYVVGDKVTLTKVTGVNSSGVRTWWMSFKLQLQKIKEKVIIEIAEAVSNEDIEIVDPKYWLI